MTAKIELNEEQVRQRLIALAGEHGPELLEAAVQDMEQVALGHLASASRCGAADMKTMLEHLCKASLFGEAAQLAERAEALGIVREELLVQFEFGDRLSVSLEELRRNHRQAKFRIGERVYQRVEGVEDIHDESEIPQVGHMEVVVCSVENGYDYVQYMVGMLDPMGRTVDLIDNWVDESELATDPELLPDEERPVQRIKPRLSIVRGD
jgi:hypothetical protein